MTTEECVGRYHKGFLVSPTQGVENRRQILLAAGTHDLEFEADAVAAAALSFDADAVRGSGGLTSSTMVVAFGSASCINCSRFDANSTFIDMIPVKLLPGLFRLETRPSQIGSPLVVNTTGIVVFAAFAAAAAGVLVAAITLALRRTQIGNDRRQSFIVPLRPVTLDRHVAAFDKTLVILSFQQRGHRGITAR